MKGVSRALKIGLEGEGWRESVAQTTAELESRYELTKDHLTTIFQFLHIFGDRKKSVRDIGYDDDRWKGLPAKDHALWKACLCLSRRNWFNRVWTARKLIIPLMHGDISLGVGTGWVEPIYMCIGLLLC